MNLYSLYDVVADSFGPPFVAQNDGVALRMIKQMLQSEKAVFVEDYQLYCLSGWVPDSPEPIVLTGLQPSSVSDGKAFCIPRQVVIPSSMFRSQQQQDV